MPNISVFDNLSQEEIDIIEDEIKRRNFKNMTAISEWCKEHGWQIERGAIWTRSAKVKKRQQMLKEATDTALYLNEKVKDDGGSLHDATLSIIQARLFNCMNDLDDDADPIEHVELLGKAARASADVSRASVSVKKYQYEAQIRKNALEEAAKRIGEAAKAQGLDESQAEFWRSKVLMGGV